MPPSNSSNSSNNSNKSTDKSLNWNLFVPVVKIGVVKDNGEVFYRRVDLTAWRKQRKAHAARLEEEMSTTPAAALASSPTLMMELLQSLQHTAEILYQDVRILDGDPHLTTTHTPSLDQLVRENRVSGGVLECESRSGVEYRVILYMLDEAGDKLLVSTPRELQYALQQPLLRGKWKQQQQQQQEEEEEAPNHKPNNAVLTLQAKVVLLGPMNPPKAKAAKKRSTPVVVVARIRRSAGTAHPTR